jgi:hypothetical protein
MFNAQGHYTCDKPCQKMAMKKRGQGKEQKIEINSVDT